MAGANPNDAKFILITPLMQAVLDKNLAMTKLLLSYGASTDTKILFLDMNPLQLSIINGTKEITYLLLEKSTNINDQSNLFKMPALYFAIGTEDIMLTQKLIEKGADVNQQDGLVQTTPLHIATGLNNRELLSLVLKSGATINATDKEGTTALFLPAQLGHTEIVNQLLLAGADVNAKDNAGNTPLTKVLRFDSLYNKKELEEFIKNNSERTKAANTETSPLKIQKTQILLENNTQIVRMLLQAGATVTVRDGEGYTPLHYAVSKGNLEEVQLLLAAGADVNALNYKNHKTPLHEAINENPNAEEILSLLIEAGGSLSEKTTEGETPLQLAEKQQITKPLATLISQYTQEEGERSYYPSPTNRQYR
jgi:ankyrin repeat protein